MKKYIGILLISLILTMSIATASIVQMPENYHGPKIKDKYGDSTNWGGYAVLGPDKSVTYVKGSWVVPTVTCSDTNSYSAFWIGIDGDTSNTVEQIGTSSDCNSGVATYYSWYEFYPKPAFYALRDIQAGDIMSAEVKFINGKFQVSITNSRAGTVVGTFTKSAKVGNANRNSAEWIAEAPYSGGVLPLANFGVANFGMDYTGITGTNVATVGSSTGNIGSFSPASIDKITMVNSVGSIKAYPSSISTDGTSFDVTWVSP